MFPQESSLLGARVLVNWRPGDSSGSSSGTFSYSASTLSQSLSQRRRPCMGSGGEPGAPSETAKNP